MPLFRGETFQSLTFRLKDPASFDEAKRMLEADKRLTVDVYRESEFYAKQSELLGSILQVLAIMITGIMAVGAIFGAVNTMYAAVAAADSGDRRAAHARLPPAERAGELPGRVGADRAGRRRDRRAARAPDQRHRHQYHQLGQLQRDRVQLPGHAGAAAGGNDLRPGDGAGGRVLPRPARGEAAGGAGAADEPRRRRSPRSSSSSFWGSISPRCSTGASGARSGPSCAGPCTRTPAAPDRWRRTSGGSSR